LFGPFSAKELNVTDLRSF